MYALARPSPAPPPVTLLPLSSLPPSLSVGLTKITICRPDGLGEPLRKAHCAALGRALVANTTVASLHLRRAGLWTDSVAALVPPSPCPHLVNLKLDSNSLGYLSGAAFDAAVDELLGAFPRLSHFHVGNNSLSSEQAAAIARAVRAHRLDSLKCVTIGSNDIGDAGLKSILEALPAGLCQLYAHGVAATDKSVGVLADLLNRCPVLWGLGINGNNLSDVGARALARALAGRPVLRDVGLTLSDTTDAGMAALAGALRTCPKLRFVYVYTTGYKSASKVTPAGLKAIKDALPSYAMLASSHSFSRYIKTFD